MVSIPQWFGSNFDTKDRESLVKMVSIPQWFGSNLDRQEFFVVFENVSIPQWFGSNVVDAAGDDDVSVFPSHNGSDQTYFFTSV